MDPNKLKAIISNTLGVEAEEFHPEAHFLLDFNASPKELMEIKNQVESEFDITLPFNDIDEFPETYEELELIVHDSCL